MQQKHAKLAGQEVAVVVYVVVVLIVLVLVLCNGVRCTDRIGVGDGVNVSHSGGCGIRSHDSGVRFELIFSAHFMRRSRAS